MNKFLKKGQSTLEYAVVIAVVIAGLLALQHYMNRGVQGKLRQSADDIGEQYSVGHSTRNTSITYDQNVSRDGFGVNTDGATAAQGVSWSQVVTSGTVHQTATANINTNLNNESLFSQ